MRANGPMWTLLLLLCVALAGCTHDGEGSGDGDGSPGGTDVNQGNGPECAAPGPAPSGNPQVRICTNKGTIQGEMFVDKVPITACNFLNLARTGYYDGVGFHRIMTGFMMQGGDPEGTGRGGDAYGGGSIPDEFHQDLRHDGPGTFSMANSGPNTGGSQFFITFVATPWLDDRHSVFGQVTAGMETVERVEREAASQAGTPRSEVTMQSVLTSDVPEVCSQEIPPPAVPCADGMRDPQTLRSPDNPRVELVTSNGTIVVELFDDQAPETVANFLGYVDARFYDGLLIHRIVKGFALQMGGMQPNGTMKGPTQPPIANEADQACIHNAAMSLAMARTAHPDSARNQFFINLADNGGLDPGGITAAGYAVFGLVVSGEDVVRAIEAVPTQDYESGTPCQPDNSPSCPVEPVRLVAVRLAPS